MKGCSQCRYRVVPPSKAGSQSNRRRPSRCRHLGRFHRCRSLCVSTSCRVSAPRAEAKPRRHTKQKSRRAPVRGLTAATHRLRTRVHNYPCVVARQSARSGFRGVLQVSTPAWGSARGRPLNTRVYVKQQVIEYLGAHGPNTQLDAWNSDGTQNGGVVATIEPFSAKLPLGSR